ncbi:archease [Candidatus Woesearchaeota archaeon CG10_big_fil_rev_8_21_14_0_10_45_16]|nr:MAG: archease [Candidatus Woesearchaeota archaeon CG10_big_fil_rev_8_21_14_0_10_45_16]
MEASYQFIDHTADVLFKAAAKTLPELFEQCGLAVEETQVDLSKVEQKKKTRFSVEGKDTERLLFNFLDELLFYKDAEQLLFNRFEIEIKEKEGGFKLHCIAHGEKLDVEKHHPKVDVKAITMHLFKVEKKRNGWEAQVLIDI